MVESESYGIQISLLPILLFAAGVAVVGAIFYWLMTRKK